MIDSGSYGTAAKHLYDVIFFTLLALCYIFDVALIPYCKFAMFLAVGEVSLFLY